MWYLQTAVESLILPTDAEGHTTLAGNIAPWHHVVRSGSHSVEERIAIAAAPVRWTIWAWQQRARRVLLPDALAANQALARMMRAQPSRACAWAHFPKPGKRRSDQTIEVVVVVPPDHFSRYESLVRFAMTMASGSVALTLPVPAVPAVPGKEGHPTPDPLIGPASEAVMEGMEMVVSRAKGQKFGRGDLRAERRTPGEDTRSPTLSPDEDDDWLLFAAAPPVKATPTPE